MGAKIWISHLLDLLFPPKCTFCHDLLEAEEKAGRICTRCQRELQPERLALQGEFLDGGLSIYIYEGHVRRSIHRFKFNGRKEYAPVYARLLCSIAESVEWIKEAELVTFVPTNRRNERKRGYNHAALLAEHIAQNLGLHFRPMLSKTRETKAMYGLKPYERRANIMGAIKVACEPEQIIGKTILLIDDIFTTGATAGECARMLRMAGAAKVFVLTVAKTDKSY